jgi:hypothetical protein
MFVGSRNVNDCWCREREQFEVELERSLQAYVFVVRPVERSLSIRLDLAVSPRCSRAYSIPTVRRTANHAWTVLHYRHGKDHNTKCSIAKYPLVSLITQRFPRVCREKGLCQEGGVRKPSCVYQCISWRKITLRGETWDQRTSVQTCFACQSAFAINSQHLRMPVDSVCWSIAAPSTHLLVGGPVSSSSATSVSLLETSN